MPAVSSTAISYIEWFEDTEDMVVIFIGGNSFTYTEVPKEVYEDFINAGSIGGFFNDNIKGVYG